MSVENYVTRNLLQQQPGRVLFGNPNFDSIDDVVKYDSRRAMMLYAFKTLGAYLLSRNVMSLVGCNKPGPTQPSTIPESTSSQYDPVGHEYRLVDDNRENTKMWVKLAAEPVPPRGSQVKIGQRACPTDCFQFSLKGGLDPVLENPYVSAFFEVIMSRDGESEDFRAGSFSVMNGSDTTISRGPWFFDFAPKYLIIKGTQNPIVQEEYKYGKTRILLDYR